MFLILLIFSNLSCKTNNAKSNLRVTKLRTYQNYLRYSIKGHRLHFEQILRKIKDTTKTPRGINKIRQLEELKKYSSYIAGDIEDIIFKVNKRADESNVEHLMLQKKRAGYANILIRKLQYYYKEYQQKNLKYLINSISWDKRYIKLLPEKHTKKIPTFGEFYFKGASKDEVLLTLNFLLLAIEQEALEIQQKIIYEK